MIWIKCLALVLGILVVIVIGRAVYGVSRWAASTRVLLAQLEATRLSPAPSRYDARELDGLPPPVQRYFRTVLKDGKPIIAAVGVDHAAIFNMGETADNWKPPTTGNHSPLSSGW